MSAYWKLHIHPYCVVCPYCTLPGTLGVCLVMRIIWWSWMPPLRRQCHMSLTCWQCTYSICLTTIVIFIAMTDIFYPQLVSRSRWQYLSMIVLVFFTTLFWYGCETFLFYLNSLLSRIIYYHVSWCEKYPSDPLNLTLKSIFFGCASPFLYLLDK